MIFYMDQETITKAQKHLKNYDPVMAKLIGSFDFSLNINSNYLEALSKTIVDQQLNVKVASIIYKRFQDLIKDNSSFIEVLGIDDSILRRLGLSYSKISYLKDLAQKYQNREINFEAFPRMDDVSVIKELTKIKGIGIWSAQMFLIFSLARSNVLPVIDGGIRRAIQINYGLSRKPSELEIESMAKKYNWEPYQSIVSIYLWASLKNSPKA